MNIVENITKFSDLASNDSLSSFKGHTSQQFHGAYEVFYNFIKEVKPNRILEIGTALGGFTSFLKIICDELKLDTNIRSYDIHRHPWYDSIIALGVDIRVENIFSENFVDMCDEVKEYINQKGVTVVLCDGGWKVGEFNLISNYIKEGDFILAHDYAVNREIFDEKIYGRIWNWFEIQESDIMECSIKNNLIPHKKEAFESVAWVCKRKEKI
jgi:hypothetical protein